MGLSSNAIFQIWNLEFSKAGTQNLLPPRPPKRRPPLLFKEGSFGNLESGIGNPEFSKPGTQNATAFQKFHDFTSFQCFTLFHEKRDALAETKHPEIGIPVYSLWRATVWYDRSDLVQTERPRGACLRGPLFAHYALSYLLLSHIHRLDRCTGCDEFSGSFLRSSRVQSGERK